MNSFCPKCGASEGNFIKGFCEKCFLEDHEIVFVPEKIEVDYCTKCEGILFKGKMSDQTPELLEEIIRSKIKVKDLLNEKLSIELVPFGDDKSKAIITFSGEVDSQKISFQKETLLKPLNICCKDCSKLVGGYFEAILQVRGEKELTEKIISFSEKFLEKEKKFDRLAKITKLEKDKHGFNAYLASKQAALKLAREIASRHNSRMTSSSKIVGRKAGRDVKRVTFCVRV